MKWLQAVDAISDWIGLSGWSKLLEQRDRDRDGDGDRDGDRERDGDRDG